MIYSLRGKLIFAEANAVVIECGGVGYRCAVSMNTRAQMPHIGEETFVFTYMNVREDAVDLFGFADENELSTFKLLTSVNGVGPKVALALLSDFTASKLALAVASNDAKALTKAAGVGTKLAQRIVLELKDKLGALGSLSKEDSSVIESISAAAAKHGNISEATAALVSLGYGQSEAAAVLAGCSEDTAVEELIKTALKKLARF